MIAGREYRTIERYNGKPVYVKLVNCGAGPNNSSKEILHGENLCIVDYNGVFIAGNDCLTMGWSDEIYKEGSHLGVSHSRIKITTSANFSLYTAYVWLKYTKTTD
jgi:hypothetical protein